MRIRNFTLKAILASFCLSFVVHSQAQTTRTTDALKSPGLNKSQGAGWLGAKQPGNQQWMGNLKETLNSPLLRTNTLGETANTHRGSRRNAPSPETVAGMKALRKESITARRKSVKSSARIAATSVLYVDQNVYDGANDGTSWENAYVELSDALRHAANNGGVDEIWVAYGIYHPLYLADNVNSAPGTSRDNAFVLVNNVKIYGGFQGFETSLEERFLRPDNAFGSVSGTAGLLGSTILSGDFAMDDGSAEDLYSNTNENAYHVVVSAGDVGSAVLDGVIIEGGNANGSSSLTIGDYDIDRNSGGGIIAAESSPMLTNVVIQYNQATSGAALYSSFSSPVITGALVVFNQSHTGGIYFSHSGGVITNATIARNTTDNPEGEAAAFYFSGGATNPRVRNTIVYSNGIEANPSLSLTGGAAPAFSYSLIQGSGGSTSWNASFGNDNGHNLDTDPKFFDSARGSFALSPASPALNTGNNAYFDPTELPNLSNIATDLYGTPRIYKGTVDLGAIESLYGTLVSGLSPADGRIYVKKNGAGTKNGSSWANAVGEVADAMFAAQLNPQIKEIWVAGGVYHPRYRADDLSDDNPSDRANAFLMVRDVKMYGGFKGDESTLDQRDLSKRQNASILSADLPDDDEDFDFDTIFEQEEAPAGIENNAFGLVYAVGDMEGAVLDGFTVKDIHQLSLLYGESGDDPEESFLNAYLLINDVTIPIVMGSGLTVLAPKMEISNVTIVKNMGLFGSGLLSISGDLLLHNINVFHNFSYLLAGGITSVGSNLSLINATVTRNLSLSGSNGVALVGGQNRIANSIIYDNFSESGIPEMLIELDYFDPLSLVISNSIVGGSGGSGAAWDDYFGLDGGNNLDEDPLFYDPSTGDFSLQACSPAIGLGDNSFYESGGLPDLTGVKTDLAGYRRINQGTVDAGAYEFQSDQSPDVRPLAGNGRQSTYEFDSDTPHTFITSATCHEEILTLAPGNLTGHVSAKVWVDNKVKSFNDAFYVQRHYDINPDNSTRTARITLYFTQTDFDNFNLLVTPDAWLPTGQGEPTEEDARIANLRIYQFHGSSGDGSGDPSSYTGDRTTLTPVTNGITWNSTSERWEVTVDVEEFSGFFAGTATQSPLPVRLLSFEGRPAELNKVHLTWKVAAQENIQAYGVEYSDNARNFVTLAELPANALANTQYSYTDQQAHTGKLAYYRLRIIETDRQSSYSRLISVRLPGAGIMSLYPVPAQNSVTLDWEEHPDNSAVLADSHGRIIKTIHRTQAREDIDISTLPAGIYILKTTKGNSFKLIKE